MTQLLSEGSYRQAQRRWVPWLLRYGLALALFGATVGLSLLLQYLDVRINLTIPIVLAMVAAAWYGGRGPGLLIGVLFQSIAIYYKPIPADSTLAQAIFSHFSILALYVFLALLISGLRRVLEDLRQERDRLREAESVTARRTLEITGLFNFTDRLQQARSMDEVYEAALDAMVTVLECDRSSVLIFDDGGVMRFVASRGLSEGYRKAVEGHSPWKPDETSARPFGIEDLDTAELDEQLRTTIRDEGIASLGFLPLISGQRLIGKMMVYFDRPHNFTETEFEMAMTVGNQIAAGVERKRAETRLFENEERLRLATQTGQVGVWDWDVRSDRIEWTDSVYAIHGVNKGEFDGTVAAFAAIVHPDDRAFVQKRIEQALSGEVPYDIQFRLRRGDGSIRHLFTNAVVLRDGNGPFRMIGATVDITDRLEHEKALREAEMMQRLVEAQESERRRIARDLHDHLGQRMTALRLQIETFSDHAGADPKVNVNIEAVKDAAMQIDRDIGFLSWELRPTELEELGLEDALRTFVREWSKQYGIAADFHSGKSGTGRSGRLPASYETNLYRIVQEALNNVHKHAGATEVSVLLQRRDNDVALIIEDNGRGFEHGSGRLNGHSRGLGLIGMRERAAVMKGTLEIDTGEKSGTTIVVRIPIAEQAPSQAPGLNGNAIAPAAPISAAKKARVRRPV